MFKRLFLTLALLATLVTAFPVHAEDTIPPIQRLGTGIPTSIAASPNGKTLAVGSSIGVWLLESNTLKPFGFWDTGAWVKTVDYSSDGRYLQINATVYEVVSGRPANLDAKQIAWLDHRCDISKILCADARDLDHIMVTNTKTQVVVGLFRNQIGVLDATFSPDGQILYSVVGGAIKALDSKGRLKGQLENFFTGLLQVVFWSENGSEVMSQNLDSVTCRIGCGSQYRGRYSPDGLNVYAPRSVWNVDTAQLVRSDDCWYGLLTCEWPAMTNWYNKIQIREPSSGNVLREFRPHRFSLSAAALSVDGKWLASSGVDNFLSYETEEFRGFTAVGSIRVWDAATFKLMGELPEQLYDLAFSPDGNYLAGHTRSSLEVWDWKNKHLVWSASESLIAIDQSTTISSYDRYLYQKPHGVAISPVDDLVATFALSTSQSVHLYRFSTGELIATLTGHTAPITGLAFSPNGRKIAASSGDGTVLVWNVP